MSSDESTIFWQGANIISYTRPIKLNNRLEEKDIYIKYRDSTCGFDTVDLFMWDSLTIVPKSKYDNVIGWIKFKK